MSIIGDMLIEARLIETEATKISKKYEKALEMLYAYIDSLANQRISTPKYIKSILTFIDENFYDLSPKMLNTIKGIGIDSARTFSIKEDKISKELDKLSVTQYGTITESARQLIDDFRNKVRTSMVESETRSRARTMNSRVLRTLYGSNLAHNAKSFARTASKASAEHIREIARRDDPDIIGYQWVSVLDGVTSQTCQALSGSRYYYNRSGYKPLPPQHPNCRSSTVPIEANGANKEELDNLKNSSFKKWAADPANDDELRESLGASRYKLFKEGKLKIERFTGIHFQPLTLEQLRKRNERAFEKANL